VKPKLGLLALVWVYWLSACAPAQSPPAAVNGVLDLTGWDFDRDGPVNLDGEWEMYWQQLLTPADFALSAPPQPTRLYPFPSAWNTLRLRDQPFPNDGYLTLRLRLKAPPTDQPYGMFVPSFNTAYGVWVNGENVAGSGGVAASAAEAQSAGFSRFTRFSASGDTLDVIVQAASFEGVPGGPIGRFTLGPATVVETWDHRQIATDLFVVSTCFIIGVYYLGLYGLRRKERAFLWFSLFCLLIALRTLLVGREVIHLLWPAITWRFSLQLIFLFGQMAAPIFAAFIAALYPQEAWPRATPWILAAGLALAIFVLLTPPSIFFGWGALFNSFTVIVALYAIVIGVRAVRRRRTGALLLLLSTLPLLLATIVEALGFLRIIPLYSVAGFGVLGTIIGQTFTLSRNFTRSFAAVEALSEQLERTNKAYYRFVPRELLRLMGKADIVAVELGDQTQKTMTVLFSDVRGFTSLSEKMSPEENFTFINLLLGRLSPVIREQRGFIDKYMGDGIMALFPESAADAVQAAIGMRRALTAFNAAREAHGQPPIKIGIGLHAGQLMLGTVGEPERMDGTVIADAVNTASRLESLTKRFGVTTIVSEPTLSAAGDLNGLAVRRLGRVRAKGKQESVTLYEVFEGDPEAAARLKRETRADFEEGLSLYQTGQFAEAQACFERVLHAHTGDAAAEYYRAQTARFITHGAPEDWDGVEALTEK